MYYKVIKDGVRYVDAMGQEKRAAKGSVIYMEQRMEVKRLKKEGRICQIPDDEVTADKDFFLKHEEEPAEKKIVGKKEGEEGEGKQNDYQPEVGDLVEGEVEGKKLIGEVVTVLKSGKLKVAFAKDSKKHRQVKVEDIEVIG